jgi:hypothetical protein
MLLSKLNNLWNNILASQINFKFNLQFKLYQINLKFILSHDKISYYVFFALCFYLLFFSELCSHIKKKIQKKLKIHKITQIFLFINEFCIIFKMLWKYITLVFLNYNIFLKNLFLDFVFLKMSNFFCILLSNYSIINFHEHSFFFFFTFSERERIFFIKVVSLFFDFVFRIPHLFINFKNNKNIIFIYQNLLNIMKMPIFLKNF